MMNHAITVCQVNGIGSGAKVADIIEITELPDTLASGSAGSPGSALAEKPSRDGISGRGETREYEDLVSHSNVPAVVPVVQRCPHLRRKSDHTVPKAISSARGNLLHMGPQIGKGGYSRCYSVCTENRGEMYAAKTIVRSSLSRSSMLRLEREIRIHERLRHPNIVQFLELIEDNDHIYLVLEHCANSSLNDLVARRGAISEAEAHSLVVPIFEAVQFLHAQLIQHGDLKPSNILLDSAMRPKIADFGFAKRLRTANEVRLSMCGTPAYMAPEIINTPCQFGLAADVWSLGIIVYMLLYGETAFDADTVDAVYDRIRAYDLRMPLERIKLSWSAICLIMQMLAVQPMQRPTVASLLLSPWITNAPAFRTLTAKRHHRLRFAFPKSLKFGKRPVHTSAN